MIKKSIFILLFVFSFSLEAAISLDVSPNPVRFGQSFKLVLTQTGTTQINTPDLTPLQADFTIVGTAKSSNYSIINGQASSNNQWTIVLMPKRLGKFDIPSLNFGSEKTNPLTIEVLGSKDNADGDVNANTGLSNTDKDLMFLTEVSNPKPYLNEAVIYTVKLYKKLDLLDASYEPPTVTDALLIPLGQGRRYQDTKYGHNYAVEEQRYAIFPQKSGVLTIKAPLLQALVFRQMPEKMRVTAPNTRLNAQGIPANYKGTNWIPAKELILQELYDKNDAKFSEGSTLVRTITLEARGLPAELLPDLRLAKTQNFSLYQEKANLKNHLKNGALIGSKTLKLTYLLNKAGKFEIPAIEVSWFNTENRQQENATLPARSLVVEALLIPEKAKTTALPLPVMNKDDSKSLRQIPLQTNFGIVSVALVFALLWLITLFLWWQWPHLFSKKRGKKSKKQLHEACLNNQPNLAKKALLAWAKEVWPDEHILDLAHIMRLIEDDETFKSEIKGLIDTLYQPKPKHWQGNALWQSFTAYRQKSSANKKKGSLLPPTNPN